MSHVTDNRSEQQAAAQLASIKELVAARRAAEAADDHIAHDEARNRIHEDALDVSVRDGWRQIGHKSEGPEEYLILLCTGGPACRIIGQLNDSNEAETARIEHQDWGTPWTEYDISAEDEEIVLDYANTFYFGDA